MDLNKFNEQAEEIRDNLNTISQQEFYRLHWMKDLIYLKGEDIYELLEQTQEKVEALLELINKE